MSALDKSIQNESRHAVYLQRYAGGLSKEFEPFLDELKDKISLELYKLDATEFRRAKLNRMLDRIEKMQRGVFGRLSDSLLEQLELFAEHEIAFEIGSLDSVIMSGSVELSAPAPVQVWAAATTDPLIFPDSDVNVVMRDYVSQWTNKYSAKVRSRITNGFAMGETTQKIVQSIVGKGSIVDKKVRAEMKQIVRTSLAHVSTVARHKVMEDNDDIVIGYEWISTLDGRTSDICRGLDGKEFYNKDKGYKPKPPLHPNERSVTSPIIDKRYRIDVDTATRASKMGGKAGQVSAKETYYSMLKKEPRQSVIDILGKTRGKLFLDGGLSAKEFANLTTDQKFRPLNNKELRAKDPQLFERVGL